MSLAKHMPKTTLAQKSAASMVIPLFTMGIQSKALALQLTTMICATLIIISIVISDAIIRKARTKVAIHA